MPPRPLFLTVLPTVTATSHPDLSDIVFDDWVERWLPRSWRPYARLCRLDRPIGTWLTLLPCIAALVQAAGGWPDVWRLIIFSLGALLMRGIGCTVNDMWDRDIDKHVERTRFRPLTSGQLSMRQAVWFLLGQLLVCASLLFFINDLSRWWALGVLPFVFIYPFCKRVTYWPQAVLGVCFNWGMLMAWTDTQNHLPLAGVAMWLGAVLWQIGYDSIYAYVDVRDDRKLGLHSTAMRFADQGKRWIGGFYLASALLWAWAGYAMGMGWTYFVGMALVALHLTWQLLVFDLRRPDRNFMLFRANLWTGVLLIASALAGTLL
ncbi:4-hydroxybenzoate octaprenyltransferase [Bordetella avium]|nr:4-hydroxybenzoate octaprenyltransferase [Bordetella avium]AZY47784.1 4-hydroxybenzoate octaprenyltransferase [Bordetella avium]AZY51155.1 4-hydroxybenzoate octaprenyltransferase [Bordetella avium]RIQ14989.1 4-hydroxybenzoate octaprenyltransferase [Bordetella avium]RIQ18520.1 4-hydroxybenzoate octaprenyltransferase [Bordetella avium]RIQ35444.1 4-hydroxybenzoate octaprenyltransferase [Bordetella avium]